jgi:hypothetical protein
MPSLATDCYADTYTYTQVRPTAHKRSRGRDSRGRTGERGKREQNQLKQIRQTTLLSIRLILSKIVYRVVWIDARREGRHPRYTY